MVLRSVGYGNSDSCLAGFGLVVEEYLRKIEETASDKLKGLRRKQLHEYYEYFALTHRTFGVGAVQEREAAAERMRLIQGEIDRRHSRTNTWIAVIGLFVTVVFGVAQCRARAVSSKSQQEQAAPSATMPLTNAEPLATATSEPKATQPLPQSTQLPRP
jgi:hypothetical protein